MGVEASSGAVDPNPLYRYSAGVKNSEVFSNRTTFKSLVGESHVVPLEASLIQIALVEQHLDRSILDR